MKDRQNDAESEESAEKKTARNRCAVCNQVVEGEVVFAAKRFWCRYHFTCSRCNITLRGDKYNVLEDKHYCIECFDFIRPRCDKCKKAIETKQEYVKYDDDQVFHRHCFLCEDCDQMLDPDAFVVEKKDFLCAQCSIDRHEGKKGKKRDKKSSQKVEA